MEFFDQYQPFLEKLLLFLAVYLFIGLVSKYLLRQVILSFEKSGGMAGNRMSLSDWTRRLLKVANLVSWFSALVIALYALREGTIAQFVIKLAFYPPFFVALFIVASLIGYSFSQTGNELVLSLIGYWYLKREVGKFDNNKTFDLGDGRVVRVDSIDWLHTVLRNEDGSKFNLANAVVMSKLFGLSLYKPLK